MLALGTYSEFTTGGFFGEGIWSINPYNKANGGPAAAPDDFWTNPMARTFYKRRLRYLIARYGAYTSLGFWEFWNEKEAPAPWVEEMAAYLKANDPYRHLVTNSYSTTGEAAVWSLANIDLTQTHRYGDEGSMHDITPIIIDDARAHDTFRKPHHIGEFGISWRGSDEKFDPKGTATNLHNGLWAAALAGNAGGAAIWWWDSYIAPKNLYGEFTGLARFAAAVDWPRRHFAPVAVPTPRVSTRTPETFSDLALTPSGGWGDKATGTVTVAKDGSVSGGKLLGTLYGSEKPDLKTALRLAVDLPHPSRLMLRILTVSNAAAIHVAVDGATAADFPLKAAPGNNQDFESTKQFPEYGGMYQALFNKDRVVPIPAGKHTITLENTAGDWVSIGSYTLTEAKSSRYAGLRPLALSDAHTGETLAWLQDPDSNWYNDSQGITPHTWARIALTLPVPLAGAYRVDWWDTRAGKIVRTETVAAKGGVLTVNTPAFTRDIALRAAPR